MKFKISTESFESLLDESDFNKSSHSLPLFDSIYESDMENVTPAWLDGFSIQSEDLVSNVSEEMSVKDMLVFEHQLTACIGQNYFKTIFSLPALYTQQDVRRSFLNLMKEFHYDSLFHADLKGDATSIFQLLVFYYKNFRLLDHECGWDRRFVFQNWGPNYLDHNAVGGRTSFPIPLPYHSTENERSKRKRDSNEASILPDEKRLKLNEDEEFDEIKFVIQLNRFHEKCFRTSEKWTKGKFASILDTPDDHSDNDIKMSFTTVKERLNCKYLQSMLNKLMDVHGILDAQYQEYYENF